MRLSLILLSVLSVNMQLSAQKVIQEASLESLVETILPNGMKQEVEFRTYLKDSVLKVATQTPMGSSMTFIDNKAKKMTTLNEIMGKKLGYYMYIHEPAESKDSIEVILIDSAKLVNGHNCKKAELRYSGRKDHMSKAEVWYTPDYSFSHPTMGLNIPGIEKLPGFPIVVQLQSTDGLNVFYTVSKIDTTTPLASSLFTIPADYQLMTMEDYKKEMAKLMQGGR